MTGKIDANMQQFINNSTNTINNITFGGSSDTNLPIFLSAPTEYTSLDAPYTSQEKSLFTSDYNKAVAMGYQMSSTDPILNFQNMLFAMATETSALIRNSQPFPGSTNGNYNTNSNGNNQPINTVNKASALSNLYNSDGTKNEKFIELENKEKEIKQETEKLKKAKDAKEKNEIAKKILQLQSEYEELERKYCDGKQLSEILGKNKYKFYSNLEGIELDGIKTANDQIESLKSQLEEAKNAYKEKYDEIQQKINEYAASHNGASIPPSELWNEDEKAEFDELGQRVANLEKQITKEIDILNKYIAKAAKQKEIGYHTFKIGYKPSTTSSTGTTGATETTATDASKKVFSDGKANEDYITETFDDISNGDKYEKADKEKIKEFLVSNAEKLQNNPKEFLEAVVNAGTGTKLFISNMNPNATANLELLMEFYDKIHGEGAFEKNVNAFKNSADMSNPINKIPDFIQNVKKAQEKREPASDSTKTGFVRKKQEASTPTTSTPTTSTPTTSTPTTSTPTTSTPTTSTPITNKPAAKPEPYSVNARNEANKKLLDWAARIYQSKNNDGSVEKDINAFLKKENLSLSAILAAADPKVRTAFLSSLWDGEISAVLIAKVKRDIANNTTNNDDERRSLTNTRMSDKTHAKDYVDTLNKFIASRGALPTESLITSEKQQLFNDILKLNQDIKSATTFLEKGNDDYKKLLVENYSDGQEGPNATDMLIDAMFNGYQGSNYENKDYSLGLIRKTCYALGLDYDAMENKDADTIKQQLIAKIKSIKSGATEEISTSIPKPTQEQVNGKLKEWATRIQIGSRNDAQVLAEIKNLNHELEYYLLEADDNVLDEFLGSLYNGKLSSDIIKYMLKFTSDRIYNPAQKLVVKTETQTTDNGYWPTTTTSHIISEPSENNANCTRVDYHTAHLDNPYSDKSFKNLLRYTIGKIREQNKQ